MEIDSKMLVASLRNYAEAKHMQLQDVGKQLGFSKDRTKSIFTGRSKLTGDDVLRILMNVDIPLPELKRYRQLWRLRREVLNFERPDDFEQYPVHRLGCCSWRMPLQRRDFSVRGTRAAEVYPEQT